MRKPKKILIEMGFTASRPFYKQRRHYELGAVHFEIDKIPGVEPYLEIETHSEKEMEQICAKLGLDHLKGTGKSMMALFPEVFQDLFKE